MTISVPGPPAQGLEPRADALIDPQVADMVRQLAGTRAGELTYMRRWLHARPEPSRKEFETTAALRARLLDIQYGRAEDSHGWLHRVL